ncbi:MAG: efflux RND transporter permease subunit, partial [Bacillota bacterium]
GDTAGKFEIEGKQTDIVLSVEGGAIPDLEAIKKMELISMAGEKVAVKDIAEVSMKPGPTSIQTRNSQQFIIVQALITDSNSGKVGEEVKAKLKGLKLPEGVSHSFEGNTEMMAQGFNDMGVAMAIAVLLVFIVMVGAFGNIRAPFAILFSLPMAIIGSLLGLYITGEELGMPALVGGLMLIGIVVTNAIVLVDRVQKQVQSGHPVDEALVEAGKTRLRPIIMTAVTTIMALMPLAVTPAAGALISRSMAVVVIGGLTTSTALTLIVVPVIYKILDNIAVFFRRRNPEADEVMI